MDAKKIFENLSKKGMFISYDSEKDINLLKNMNDEIVFRFKSVKGKSTLESLQIRIDMFKSEVENCF